MAKSERNKLRADFPSALALHGAQAITVVGVVGFLAAIVLNSVVFDAWGLNFLQLATVADIIRSGIDLAIAGIWTGVYALLGVTFSVAPWRTSVRLLLMLVSGAVLVWLLQFVTEFDEVIFVLLVSVFTFAFGNAVVLFRAFETAGVTLPTNFKEAKDLLKLIHSMPSGLKFATRRRDILAVSAIGALLVAALTVQARIAEYQVYGFNEGVLTSIGCAPGGRGVVLWVGDRALVTRCSLDEVRVTLNPENIEIFRNRQAAWFGGTSSP